MLSIFSCVSSSSVCRLWRNAFLVLFPTLWLSCLFFWFWVVWAACIFWKLILCQLFHLLFSHPVQFSCSIVSNSLRPHGSMPGFPAHHQLLEHAQIHVHWASDAIQPSHPLSSSSTPAFNLSQHQGLFQWVSSLQRRQWHPTPIFLLGKSHGWRSLVGCSPWGC